MNGPDTLRPVLDRIERRALIVGVVGLAACAVGWFVNSAEFFRAYLISWLFWVGIALGGLAILMIQHLTSGIWGFLIRRIVEAGTRTFLLLAVLFIPITFGLHSLFEWTHADVVAADPILHHKSAYLNIPFFLTRVAFYFLIWIFFARVLNRWSLDLDRTGNSTLARRLQNISAPGLLVYALTVTFASVDWVMSLEPHWFSTVFGMLLIVGQVLSAFAFTIIVARGLSEHEPMSGVMRPAHFHDLGNLTFAFVMIWAYLSFSQFLIIWSGNLPEEITWYKGRITGGWGGVAVVLVIFNFALPFLVLLMRAVKRRARWLAGVAVLILLMRLVDLQWTITPAFHEKGLHVGWMDVAATLGIGGVWVAFFIRQLKNRPVVPVQDPRIEGVFEPAHGHGD